MPKNENMKLIQTATVGSGGGSITFTGIPATYQDLSLIISCRGSRSYVFDSLQIQFNGDTAGNYSYQSIYHGNAATPVGHNQTGIGIGNAITIVDVVPAASSTSNNFGVVNVHIPNYASSAQKIALIEGGGETSSTTTGDCVRVLTSGYWNNTAAITSITIKGYNATLAQNTTASLYGITSAAASAKATGGIISDDDTYFYHAFLASGTFTPTQSITADVLVVAGGGGGGSPWNDGGGGGGAGGILYYTSQSLTATGYSVTVGGGGAVNTQGTSSTFGALSSATGGGLGGRLGTNTNGGTGGSGGGGSTSGNGGAATGSQGYAGGSGAGGSSGGGGGGGAGELGADGGGAFSAHGGRGGNGTTAYSSWNYGENVDGTYYLAGGGGGGAYTGYNASVYAGIGGRGGGGAGGGNGSNRDQAAVAGRANTGGGGGGTGYYSSSLAGAAGGSGIIIVRYAK